MQKAADMQYLLCKLHNRGTCPRSCKSPALSTAAPAVYQLHVRNPQAITDGAGHRRASWSLEQT